MKFKLADYLYPFEILKLYRNLQKSKKYSYKQLIELQNRKLRIIINQAFHKVPYYNELFEKFNLKPEDIQTIDDLPQIPVLTKDIIRNRFNDLIATNSDTFKPYFNYTSGSTGTPLKFLQDKHTNIARFAFFWRAWQMAGYQPYMKWAQIDGMFYPENGKIWNYNLPLNSLQISAFLLNHTNCEKIYRKLTRFKPKIIRGYPSALHILAQYIESNKLVINWEIRSIITYSEKLYPFQRNLLENVFSTKVFDLYSMWESVCIISECKKQKKHQHMEFSVFELLNESNEIVNPGNIGEITATSFYNFSMPFIRYKTGDLAIESPALCKCGLNHKKIKKIIGRKRELLFNTEGVPVPFSGFLMYQLTSYGNLQGLIQTQIIQNEYDKVDVYAIIEDSAQIDIIKNEIDKSIKNRLGEDMMITFNKVDEIKKERNGKSHFIINNLLSNE